MNANKHVVISFFDDGSTKVEAQNFKGKGCAEATQAIEIAIGGADSSNRDTKRTPDFYAQVSGSNYQTIKG